MNNENIETIVDVGVNREVRRRNGEGSIYQDKKTGIYIARIKGTDGKYHNKSTGTRDRREAEKKLREFTISTRAADTNTQLLIVKAQLEGKKLEIAQEQIDNSNFKITELEYRYYTHPECKKLSEGTKNVIHSTLQPFYRWCKSNNLFKIHDITLEKADDFLSWLKVEKSPYVYNLCVMELKKIINTIKRTYNITDNHFENRARRKEETKKVVRSLSHDEMSRLLDYLRTKDIETQVFWAFGYSCGMSSYDAAHIKWGNVNFDNDIITYRRKKTGQQAIPPISQDLKTLLAKLPKGSDDEFVCPSYAQALHQTLIRRIRDTWINCKIERETKEGLVRFHSQRHTLVNNLLSHGVSNVAAIADILGHKQTSTHAITFGYHNQSIAEVKAAIAKLGDTADDNITETVTVTKGLKSKLDAVGITVDNAIRLFLASLDDTRV